MHSPVGYLQLLEDTVSVYLDHPVLPVLYSFLIPFAAFNTMVSSIPLLVMVRSLEAVLLIFATGVVFEMAAVMETGGTANLWEAWHRFEEKEGRVLLGEFARYTAAVIPLLFAAVFAASGAVLGVAAAVFSVSLPGVQPVLLAAALTALLLSFAVAVALFFTMPEIVIREKPVAAALKGSARFVQANLKQVTGFLAVSTVLFTGFALVFAVAGGFAAGTVPGALPLLAATFFTFTLPFFAVFQALFYIRVRRG